MKPTAPTTPPFPYTTSPGGDGPGPSDMAPPSDAVPSEAASEGGDPTRGPITEPLWWAAGVLFARRWFLIGTTLLVAAAAAGISFLITPEYVASTRLLLPQRSGNASMLGMLERVAPGASALLGGRGGDYTRYLSILTSYTVQARAVERFDLTTVYETADSEDPVGDAVNVLSRRLGYTVALDFDYLTITVQDRDPERAAALANFLVAELNRENIRLSSSSAREDRVFLERRLEEAEAALDSAKTEMEAFQESSGVVNFDQQGEAYFAAIAQMRAETARLDVEYNALRQQYGDDNPQVAAAAAAVAAAQGQIDRALAGGDPMLPVPREAIASVGRRYADLYQEVYAEGKIVEFLRPLYEQARFSEQQETSAVQVLDPAEVPRRKALPQRRVIVMVALFSAFLISIVFVLARAWLHRYAPQIAAHLRAAT